MKQDIGLLILRLGIGGFMFFAHGLPKLMKFSQLSSTFPNIMGLGSSFSLVLAIFAEVLCALAIMSGLLTRLASVPLLITMLVAAFVVHGADPWAKKEFALLYAIPFLTLCFTGAGKFSLDALLLKRK